MPVSALRGNDRGSHAAILLCTFDMLKLNRGVVDVKLIVQHVVQLRSDCRTLGRANILDRHVTRQRV